MTTMELTHDAAQAEVTRIQAQHHEWTNRRAQLVIDLDTLQAQAGEQALAGDEPAEIADRIGRMQTQLQIVDRSLQVIDTRLQDARQAAQRARIADAHTQIAQLRDQAAAIRAACEPHLAALERLEGLRPPMPAGARSVQLDVQAHRLELNTEHLAYRLEHPNGRG